MSVDRQRSTVTLDQYATTWIDERDIRPRTEELYLLQLRLHISPELGAARINRLRPDDIRTWYSQLSGRLGQVSVAKTYRLLRSVLNTAVEDGLLDKNPCQIRNGGVERSQERPLPEVEHIARIGEYLPAHLQAVIWIAALAGLRKGEILGLARRHVDLRAESIRVDQALQEVTGIGAVMVPPKTASSRRTVVIPTYLVELLRQHLDDHVEAGADALLFTNSAGRPVRATVWTKAWGEARIAAELPDTRLHDFRHLAGTLTAQAGATMRETMDRLGHSSSVAALRYQHTASERSYDIATRIGESLQPSETQLRSD